MDCRVSPATKPDKVKLEELMRTTLMPEAVKLAEGNGDVMKIMRTVLKRVNKDVPSEILKEEIRKGEMQVLNMMVQIA